MNIYDAIRSIKRKLFDWCIVTMLTYVFLLSPVCYADRASYYGEVNIIEKSDQLIVKHFHELSDVTYEKWTMKIFEKQDPFIAENDIAYIACFDRKNGKLIFKKPSPALTKIYISDDSNYIIGLSNIMSLNLYHLVIFDKYGNLIDAKHIAMSEAHLSNAEYQTFTGKFPDAFKFLDNLGRITIHENEVFISYLSIGMRENIGFKAWQFLIDRDKPSHYSNNFHSSVTNWIFWYKEPDPKIELIFKDQKLRAISLLDPEGERFQIPITQNRIKTTVPDIWTSERIIHFDDESTDLILPILFIIGFILIILIFIYFIFRRKR
jgi:hypothetical protein